MNQNIENICVTKFNSSPNDKILDETKLESNCRREFKCGSNDLFLLDRPENIVGKGENAGYQHFLLFPQCFQKAASIGTLKIVW